MLEIPNLNKIYEDDYITLFIHDIGGEGKLFVMHADVVPSANRKVLAHVMEVVDKTFDALREKGLTEIEAWVNTDEQIHYAQFMGFNEWLGELTINGQRPFPVAYRLRKKL